LKKQHVKNVEKPICNKTLNVQTMEIRKNTRSNTYKNQWLAKLQKTQKMQNNKTSKNLKVIKNRKSQKQHHAEIGNIVKIQICKMQETQKKKN
jgi:hypothetical protein